MAAWTVEADRQGAPRRARLVDVRALEGAGRAEAGTEVGEGDAHSPGVGVARGVRRRLEVRVVGRPLAKALGRGG